MGGGNPLDGLIGGGSQGESAEEKRDREQMEQDQRDLKQEEEDKNTQAMQNQLKEMRRAGGNSPAQGGGNSTLG